MRLRTLFWGGFMVVAMALSAFPATKAAVAQACVAGEATAASFTWDFKGEANTIFKDVQDDAQQALYHADELQSFAENSNLDWQTHANQLEYLKSEINDMGAKLCRLETIRRVLAPWQQNAIDEIATDARLMAGNAQEAIVFGTSNPKELWRAGYQDHVNSLYREAQSLTHSVTHAVEFAGVSQQYQQLRKELGVRTSS